MRIRNTDPSILQTRVAEAALWLEPKLFFWHGSYSYSYYYSTVNILFLLDPKYDDDDDYGLV